MQVIVTSQEDLEAIVHKAFQDNLQKLSTLISPGLSVPEIINTEELCKRLNLTEPTVIRYRKRNKIPFLQIGSSVRYEWNSVIKALEKKKEK